MQRRNEIRSVSILAALAILGAGCGGGGGGGGGGNNAPSNLSYSRDFALYAKGVAIAPNVATVTGQVDGFEISPALPAGLAFDPLTGAISGTGTAPTPVQSYTVTASNAHGSVDAQIEIGVVRPAAMVVAANSADDTLSSFVVDAHTGALQPTGYSVSTPSADYPRGLAHHRNGQFVYVANRVSNDVTAFEIDAVSGWLGVRSSVPTACSSPNEIVAHPSQDVFYVVGRQGPPHVETFRAELDGDLVSEGSVALSNGVETAAIDSQGRWLWVANLNSDDIATLAIDPQTQQLSDTGHRAPTADKPLSLAVSPDDRFLYALTLDGSRIQVYVVNPADGSLGRVQTLLTGLLPSRLAVDPSGRFLYVSISSDDTLRTYAIDDQTGFLTALSTTPTGDRPGGIGIDPTGSYLYVTEIDGNEIGFYQVDPASGALLRKEGLRVRLQPIYLTIVPGDDPTAPRAKQAYVANAGSNDLSMFALDPNTGEMTAISAPLPAGATPASVAAHPKGTWVYAAHEGDDSVGMYTIDPLGQLVPQGAPTGVNDSPTTLAIDPSGRFLLVLSSAAGTLDVLSIDSQSGALTPTSSAPVSTAPTGLAMDPSGRFVIVSDAGDDLVSVYRIGQYDGSLTPTGVPATITGNPSAIAVHPNGRYLFVSFAGTDRVGLYAIDGLDGSISPITNRPSGVDPGAIAIDPFGRYAYVANHGGAGAGEVAIFRLDTASSVLTRIDDQVAGIHPVAAAVDPSGRFLYVASQGSNDVTRLVIDRVDGRLSQPTSVPVGATPSGLTLRGGLQ